MMDKEVKTIIDYGLASQNEKQILDFLKKIYSIPFERPKEWEKLLFDFFAEILIVPYVIETTLEEETETKEDIKNTFFKEILYKGIIHISSNQIFKDLCKIYESIKSGRKIKDYLEYLFQINSLLRRMLIKRVDEEDERFKNFGGGINPFSCILKNEDDEIVGYENIYFIIPDKNIDYPLKEWHEKISKDWRKKFQNLKKNKIKNKRNPIDSRLRHECFKRDNYTCKECGATNKEKILHADHILPVSQGGKDELDNLQTLCQDCNLAKSNKTWKSGLENDEFQKQKTKEKL